MGRISGSVLAGVLAVGLAAQGEVWPGDGVTASMYLSGGAEASFSQICLNNGNGVSGYYGRSLLDIADATVTVANGETDALALDGAVLKVPAAMAEARALKNADVALANGAKLAAPAGTPLSVRHVVLDGVLVKGGSYTAETADWVASGTVVLGGGTVMLFR